MIPLELLIIIFIAFVIIVFSAVWLGGGKPVINSIIGRFRGEEEPIKEEVDIKPAPDTWVFRKIMINNENGKRYPYSGRQELGGEEFGAYDKNGNIKELLKYHEVNMIKNLQDVLDNETDVLELQVMSNNAYANIMAKIHAKDLMIAQKDIELERISKSANIQRIHQKEQEAEEFRIKYGSRPRIKTLDKGTSKSSSQQETFDEGEEL